MSAQEPRNDHSLLPRRGLLLGAGAAAVGVSLAGALPAAAQPAAPALGGSDGGSDGGSKPAASPISSTISSPPHSGVIYRFAAFWDFTPEPANAQRLFGGRGLYTSVAGSFWASIDVPAGARIFDVEWYTYNNQTAKVVTGEARLFAAGVGSLGTTVVDVPIPVSSTLVATRVVPLSSNSGPYPLGVKMFLNFTSIGTSAAQIEGVRVGFTYGGGAVGSLPTPIRAYDSRTSGGKLHGGTTRTITLPSSIFSPGVSAIEANVTAVGATSSGYLKVYPANSAAPSASAINYSPGNTGIANAQTIGVSNAGQIKVFASTTVDFVIDVTGIIG